MRNNDLLTFSLFEDFNIDHGISNRHSEHLQQYDVIAEQVHHNTFAWVDSATLVPVSQTDALLTKEVGLRLRVGVSDCTPIILYDPSTHSGGVVHAGFQGTIREILTVVLQEFNSETVRVAIGPAIGACCYEDIDIKQENYVQAREYGVTDDRIALVDVCTKCDNGTYFSHRGGDSVNFGAYFELR